MIFILQSVVYSHTAYPIVQKIQSIIYTNYKCWLQCTTRLQCMDSLENSLRNLLKNPLCTMATTINTYDNQCCGYVATSTMLHTWLSLMFVGFSVTQFQFIGMRNSQLYTCSSAWIQGRVIISGQKLLQSLGYSYINAFTSVLH